MSSPKPLGMLNGEVKKNKQTKQEELSSVTPSIQSTDTSVSFHTLRLDSFQEIFSESLRTLVNPKDCEVPYKPVCGQKHSASLVGYET